MDFIKVNNQDYPFRMSLMGMKKLENKIGVEKFKNIDSILSNQEGLSEMIDLVVAMAVVGIEQGIKKSKSDLTITVEDIENEIDDNGQEFIEKVLTVFTEQVTTPKK